MGLVNNAVLLDNFGVHGFCNSDDNWLCVEFETKLVNGRLNQKNALTSKN